MTGAGRSVAGALVGVALLCTACGGGEGREAAVAPASLSGAPAPIVLISIDTLRSDHLPAYGYAGVKTPAIDRLRRDGILFERVYTPVPLTTPAHASMLTGLLPPAHGVRDNAGYRLDVSETTLAERLQETGYDTGAAVSSFTLRTGTGLEQGFDAYEGDFEAGRRQTIADVQRAGPATLAVISPWIERVGAGEEPFFLFFHLYEPHTPYEPPPRFARTAATAYDGEIAAADAVVGRLLELLDRLGRYDSSTIVLTSDHGEGLGDHGEEEHGILLYREALQVPLIVKLPGGERSGERVGTPVHLVDLAPTLLALAGLDSGGELPGEDLLAIESVDGDRALYSETFHPELRFGWSPLTSLVRGRHHYIEGPDPELYDVVADPGERQNLLRERRRIYASMRDELATFEPNIEPPFTESSEAQEALVSLGYVGSGAVRDAEPGPDPKSQLHTLKPLRAGIDLLKEGRPVAAETKLRTAIDLNPEFLDAWQFLGLALDEQERAAEAYAAYERAFELSNGSPLLAKPLARLALQLGRTEEAISFLEAAVAEAPRELELRFLLTSSQMRAERFGAALDSAKQTLRLAPDNADARYQVGAAHMGLREAGPAIRAFERALEIDPRHPATLSDLSTLLIYLGREEEARPLLERLATIQPGHPLVERHLGTGS